MGEPFAGAEHAVAHEPQWFGSVWRSTQLAPQRLVPAAHPLLHMKVPAMLLHTGELPLHRTPHIPQLVGSERSASHPSEPRPLQSAKPALQVYPQVVPLHVAVALAGVVHGVQDAPHESTEVFATHAPAHAWKPVLQLNPQLVPLHVADALDGGMHGVHELPQLLTPVLATHALPHTWNPALHVKPHVVPSHVPVPFAGTVQAPQDAPHEAMELLLTQALPHR